MDWISPQAQEIARLKEEARDLRKKRYRGMVGLLFGAAGLAVDLAGLPLSLSLALWGAGLAAWLFLKTV